MSISARKSLDASILNVLKEVFAQRPVAASQRAVAQCQQAGNVSGVWLNALSAGRIAAGSLAG